MVEGPTLADRISQGALALDEALSIARQIAEALEYAHERGVVHRDLKPSNIKITPEGRVKLLDFGLAKALFAEPALSDPRTSPTLTIRATIAGSIMGTAAYMSPEQARGQTTDKRTDVWSFGVVLYEMLTGRRLFDGATVSDSLAAVLRADLDWTALPAALPSNIVVMLRRCLERDPKRRLRDMGDARLELEQPVVDQVPPTPLQRAHKSSRAGWMMAAISVAIAAGISIIHFRESPAAPPHVRFIVPPPDKGVFGAWLAVSPDGHHLGFTASGADGILRVWLRSLDSLELRPLPGTDGTITFFWSPDSRYVVFQSAGKLKKMAISGGPAQTLCDSVGVLLGGSWNSDGVILFGSNNGAIMRVSSSGGIPTTVTRADPSHGESNHTDPIFLPDGRHFLYLRRSSTSEGAGIYVGALDVKPEQQSLKPIQTTGFSPGYAPSHGSSPAYLLFLRDQNLVAQPFDDRRFETIGEPIPIAEDVGTSITRGFFSASPAGVLAWRGGGGANTQFAWYDRQGNTLGRAGEQGSYLDLALSRDASHIAYDQPSQDNQQIWILDAIRGSNSRLGFLQDGSRSPVWSPDGKYVAFSSVRSGGIYVKDSSNSSNEKRLNQSLGGTYVSDWSHDGKYLLYTLAGTSLDIWALPNPLGGSEQKAFPVAVSGFNETLGRFSPDSRWIAYASDESGRFEIYVRPFPPDDGRSGKWLVSSAGGRHARWREDGKELFYIQPDLKLMAVDVTTDGGAFQFATPHPLFTAPTASSATNTQSRYDVTADGKRFLMLNVASGQLSVPTTVVLNWTADLKK